MFGSLPQKIDPKWLELEQIFAAAPVGLVLLDRDLRYRRVNAALARMVRMKPEQMLGRTVGELFPAHIEIVGPLMRQVLESGRPLHDVERNLKFEEGQLSLLSSYVPIRDVDGATAALCLVVVETTDLMKAEMEIRKARDAAEISNRAKDQFLAVLSHELRTPLTPVMAAVSDLLSRGELSEALQDDLKTIDRNIKLEARLIDDLLDFTRITRGKTILHRETADAHALLRQAIGICREDIAAKSLGLRLELNAQRQQISADPARLQQVFWNLLKNAVKFTPMGGMVTVRSSNDPGLSHLIVEVQDTGFGIDAATLPRLFKAFEQGPLKVTQAFGGLGLGLTISKALIELHGGTIAADSRGRDQGSTFTATIPLHSPAQRTLAPVALPAVSITSGVRILLVEDHPDTLHITARILRSFGHTVVPVATMAQALNAVQDQKFDLLISDLGLPDGHGHELLSRIGPMPAIALTGFGMDDDLRLSQEAGFARHLVKPIDVQQLKKAVGELLGTL